MKSNTFIKLLILHGATTLLFYHELPGLNILILHACLLVWLLIDGRNKAKGESFYGLTAVMSALAFGTFMANPPMMYIYLLLLPYWVLSGRYPLQNLVFLPLAAIVRAPMASYQLLKSYWLTIQRYGGGQSSLNKNLIKGLTVIAATGVLFIFVQFYSHANKIFGSFFEPLNNWITNINLAEFIFFQLWMQIMIRNSSTAEDKLKPYLQNLNAFFTNWMTEVMSNRSVEVLNTALNYLRTGLAIMLTFFLAAEFYTLTQPITSYADAVHETFDSMVGSFSLTILVLGIERYFIRFRREMTTYESITYRLIIGFNLVLIGLTAYKDILYINSDYLTDRRLELFIWLGLATALMLLILLSDQRRAQYHLLVDRFYLIGATFITINAAMPYSHLTFYSAVLANKPIWVLKDEASSGFEQIGFSHELQYAITDYGQVDSMKHVHPTIYQNAIYRLAYKKHGLSYTGEKHLEIMILEELKAYMARKKQN